MFSCTPGWRQLLWLTDWLWTLSTTHKLKLKLKLSYDRQSVGHFFLVLGSHHEPMTRFIFLSNNCWFLDVERHLWREVGSVIYSNSCFWVLSEQSLSGPSPAEFATIFYSLIRNSPNLECQVSVFISPWNSYTPGQWVTTRRATEEVLLTNCCEISLITSPHGPRGKHLFQQYFYCWVRGCAAITEQWVHKPQHDSKTIFSFGSSDFLHHHAQRANHTTCLTYSSKLGVGGSVVVKALCYKPEGRGFDTRWSEFLNLPILSGSTRPWGLLSH
jgi:hypothetical protein